MLNFSELLARSWMVKSNFKFPEILNSSSISKELESFSKFSNKVDMIFFSILSLDL